MSMAAGVHGEEGSSSLGAGQIGSVCVSSEDPMLVTSTGQPAHICLHTLTSASASACTQPGTHTLTHARRHACASPSFPPQHTPTYISTHAIKHTDWRSLRDHTRHTIKHLFWHLLCRHSPVYCLLDKMFWKMLVLGAKVGFRTNNPLKCLLKCLLKFLKPFKYIF